MRKGWHAVLIIVLVMLILGAVAIGVGLMTGADVDRIYTAFEGSSLYNLAQTLIAYWNELIVTLSETL